VGRHLDVQVGEWLEVNSVATVRFTAVLGVERVCGVTFVCPALRVPAEE